MYSTSKFIANKPLKIGIILFSNIFTKVSVNIYSLYEKNTSYITNVTLLCIYTDTSSISMTSRKYDVSSRNECRRLYWALYIIWNGIT